MTASIETTEGTEKIHNEETKQTKAHEEKVLPATRKRHVPSDKRVAGSTFTFVRLR